MQLSQAEEKVVDFDTRCQQVAMYLWQGKSVRITEQQLRWYDVSPHQMISELLGWVTSEEAEHIWEADRDGAYFGDGALKSRQFTVYCTKRASVYVFKAKVIG
jgi:Cft2 family RNA processing exonuclease